MKENVTEEPFSKWQLLFALADLVVDFGAPPPVSIYPPDRHIQSEDILPKEVIERRF